MKKFIVLLMFIPLVSFGQDQTTIVGVESTTKIVNERELVLSEKQIDVKTPITVDLNDYTHILIVKGLTRKPVSKAINKYFYMNKSSLSTIESTLSSSIFEILNPYTYDKKKYKKEGKNYLKTVKDESYLYLYITESTGKGDDINCSIILRDWKNKMIYSASHINYGLDEALSPIISF